MILDKLGILSKAQDLTSGSTTASTNQIKMTARDYRRMVTGRNRNNSNWRWFGHLYV